MPDLSPRDRAVLEKAFPPNGPCFLHPSLYARHRLVDAIRSQYRAGESAADLAMDFEVNTAAVRLVVAASIEDLAFLRRFRKRNRKVTS